MGLEGKETLIFQNQCLHLTRTSESCSILVVPLSCIFNLLLVTDSIISAYKPDTASARVLIYSP